MIFTYQNYIESLHDAILHKPKKVWVSSYGFNVGIGETGNIYARSETFRLFQMISNTTVGSRVLIGTSSRTASSLQRRLTNSAEYFPVLQWKTKGDIHLKCWIFFWPNQRKTALVGGRNIGDSEWADVSVWVDGGDAHRLSIFYDDLWIKAKAVPKSKGLVLK